MLITEELHLLLTRPDGRQEAASGYRSYAAIATIVIDLAAAGRVTLSDDADPKVTMTSDEPTGNAVLDTAMERLAKHDGKAFSALVAWTPLDPRDEVRDSLIEQGVLELGERGFFGLGSHRTPEANPQPEALIRSRLADVIAGRTEATGADRALLAVLKATHAAGSILRDEAAPLRGNALLKRIDDIVDAAPEGSAIDRAMQQLTASIVLSTVIPVVIAGAVANR